MSSGRPLSSVETEPDSNTERMPAASSGGHGQDGHVRQALLFGHRNGVGEHDFAGAAVTQALHGRTGQQAMGGDKRHGLRAALFSVRTASQMVPAVSIMSSTTTQSRPFTSPMMPCARHGSGAWCHGSCG